MASQAKTTLKQHIQLIRRGLGIYATLPKPMVLSASLSAAVEALMPFINLGFSAQILGELAAGRDPRRLTLLVLWTLGLNLLGLLGQKALTRWEAYCSANQWHDVYKTLTDKALSLDYGTLEDPAVQEEYSKIRQHHNGMGFGLGRLIRPIPAIFKGAVQIVLSLALAFTLFTLKVPTGSSYTWLDSWWMILAFALILAGPMALTPYLHLVGGRIWAKSSDSNNKSNRFFSFYFFRMISNSDTAKDIRIYKQKRLIHRHTRTDKGAWNTSEYEEFAKYYARFAAAGAIINQLCNGLIYLYVALKALAGAYGVGNIVLYVGAITQFGMGFSAILTNIGQLLNNNPFLEKVLHFLDTPNPMYQGSLTTEKRSDKKYEIEFRNVSFRYPGSQDYALEKVSLKFQVGQRLAIVGQNGSGKTTFIKLLCRLYDPTEGMILLNGIDIRKYKYQDYIGIFSVVFQDFKLLPLPLGQNVAASMDYDRARVTKALEQAGFGPRLATLPQGLEAHLYKNFEEEGVEVSGGEAQKIALARALYKEAPFVILDEPTAALDPLAEFEVYSRMNEIVGDKTAVFISHRLSSCRFCSDIAVFHEGRLIQRGGHEDLLAADGKYAELWNAQAQYYVEQAG